MKKVKNIHTGGFVEVDDHCSHFVSVDKCGDLGLTEPISGEYEEPTGVIWKLEPAFVYDYKDDKWEYAGYFDMR